MGHVRNAGIPEGTEGDGVVVFAKVLEGTLGEADTILQPALGTPVLVDEFQAQLPLVVQEREQLALLGEDLDTNAITRNNCDTTTTGAGHGRLLAWRGASRKGASGWVEGFR